MSPHALPWHVLARFRLIHFLGLPLDRLLSRLPPWEFGMSAPEITTISCVHAPLSGKRAVQLSDLHIERYLDRHDRMLEQIAGLVPNWIFVTGDVINASSGLLPAFRFLAGLRSLAPTFLTLGNHDHLSNVPLGRFCELADRHKLSLLVNQVTFVPLDQGELCIVGLDDPSLHRADPRCIPSRRPGRFTVVLDHAPPFSLH